jgi:hypothetical protein
MKRNEPCRDPAWPRIRLRILERDGHACQIKGPRCTGDATDVEEKISTHDLVRRLGKEGDRGDWADWWGKGVETDSDAALRSAGHQLSRTLKPFGIEPKQVWIENHKTRDYLVADFADAFERYLEPPTDPDNPPTVPGHGRTVGRRSEGMQVVPGQNSGHHL